MSNELFEDIPEALRNRLLKHRETGEDDPNELSGELIKALDGLHPDRLMAVLDGLRSQQIYDVSLVLLEAAWNAELPAPWLGRIAEDWLGTVSQGIGDPDGTRAVAEHLAKTVDDHGTAFASDFGDLLLSYAMYDLAGPFIERASQDMPGDMSARFNLGVVHKFAGRWQLARDCFEAVLSNRAHDSACLWNIGIASTGLRDWSAARDAWTKLGMELPPGDGDFAGADGQTIPIRIPCDAGSKYPNEAIWGVRIGPARARIVGIPRFATSMMLGDDVLIDGVPVGEIKGPDGTPQPILPVLEVFERRARIRYGLRAESIAPGRVDGLIDTLRQMGSAFADWRVFEFDTTYAVSVSFGPRDESFTSFHAELSDRIGFSDHRWDEILRHSTDGDS